MNIASWIILAIVIVWIGFAMRSAFFGGSKKHSCHGSDDTSACHEKSGNSRSRAEVRVLPESDDAYRLPSACAGCSKGSCAGCTSSNRDIPMPIIHELK